MLNKSAFYLKIIFILALLGGFLFTSNNFSNEPVFASEVGESDAIAVRILPNPDHYGPMLWYKKQGFKGSPTPLKVDGYEAVQDGRTVYVNVANTGVCSAAKAGGTWCTKDSDCSVGTCSSGLYTNIYLISYTQDAGPNTAAIFDSILKNWKFNINLIEPGKCFFESVSTVCLTDSDCPAGDYCGSRKARLTRDIKRLADVVEMREIIENYNKIRGYYPRLDSGTYLPGKTISTWPSWRSEFSSQIGFSAYLDPINKMGDCGGIQYDSATCWDNQNKTFAGTIPNGLPKGSYVIAYASQNNGQNYELCALMESGMLAGEEWGACVGSTIENKAPQVECGSLIGIANEEFAGYISASDSDGDQLTISVEDLPSGFILEDTANPNQKKIYSSSAPSSADGAKFRAIATDGKATTIIECSIKIHSESFIVYPIDDQRIIVGQPLNLVIYANHSKKNYNGMAFNFSGNPAGFNCVPESLKITSDGRFQCAVNWTPGSLSKQEITVNARNSLNEVSTSQKFNLESYNNPPVMNALNCKEYIRVNESGYECEVSATDPDGHEISNFNANGLPDGMNLLFVSGKNQAKISGTPGVAGKYNISITATDRFGAVSAPVGFTLQVNTYCGDGKKQIPNTEGRGGKNNDGYEDCDGKDGIPDIGNSSISWQYGCSSDCASLNDGWCGDNVIQNGKFFDFPNGVQTIAGFNLNHGKKDYGEECDFGRDINCCNKCKITMDATETYSYPEFNVFNDEAYSLELPLARGIVGGDLTILKEGSYADAAIILNSDLGHLFELKMETHKIALKQIIEDLYNESNSKDANVYVGLVGFGNCTGDPYFQPQSEKDYIAGEYPIINLKNNYNGKEDLKQYIDQHYPDIGCNNFNVDQGGNSGLPQGISYAEKIFLSYDFENETDKYMILLTDGVVSSRSNGSNYDLTTTKARSVKDNSIKIYSLTYADPKNNWYKKPIESMCLWSSDDGKNCYSGGYSYLRNTSIDEGVQLSGIFNEIKVKIIDNISKISYSFGGLSGAVSSGEKTDFNLSGVVCDKLGAVPCEPKFLNFLSSFNGNVPLKVKINLKIIPLCKNE